MSYAELQATTHFSFLRGASSADQLFSAAALMGLPAIGVVDRNSLAGIVRAHQAAETTKVRLVVGCRLDLRDFPSMLVYPRHREAYGSLCRLLSLGKARAGKGKCDLSISDVAEECGGFDAILLDGEPESCTKTLPRFKDMLGRNAASLALTRRFRPDDHVRIEALTQAARSNRVPCVATNDVLYHTPERRILQDVVTCVREKTRIDDAGFKRERYADRFLKGPEEMARLFARYPSAIERSLEISERARFSLSEIAYQYPDEISDTGLTAQQQLEKLTWEGAMKRYPDGILPKVEQILRHELALIASLEYAPYFLTVYSIVRFARSRRILCQGRGSAANSAVCFVLGITSIDPSLHDLLFERFISQERKEPPDIDVDFEHDRREEVIQWIYKTYGEENAALTAVVQRYRAKGSVRDVGKAIGLPEDITSALSEGTWAWDEEVSRDRARELNLNMADRRLNMTMALARQIFDAPRHLSQHPGGFVLTRDKLNEIVPIEPARMENRRVIEWDKDDIDALKMMKVDVLGLGMLGCMRRAFDLLEEHKGIIHDLSTIPPDDKPTYDMICRADTVGVFQIESRAQMNMLPRLKPRCFYDLVIEVALVRPGPIQGEMVHPYLRRREGKEDVVYPKPELERVLGKTLGVPLFQEQAMRVAIECAGFTAGEADQLRRAMATFKFTGGVSHFRDKLVNGMVERGYSEEFALNTFTQLEGFGSYGFPESHAASFALIAYASSWMKCHHPEVFCAAILNSLPMGFYASAQLVADAEKHGVEVRPVDVNHSTWDCTLENKSNGTLAVRLGMNVIKGMRNEDGAKLSGARFAPFTSMEDLQRRTGLGVGALEKLAEADAYRSIGLNRRDAVWAIRKLRDEPLPLFVAADERDGKISDEVSEEEFALKPMPAGREVVEDYESTGLSLKAHPLSFLRAALSRRNVVTAEDIKSIRNGRKIKVAGIVLVRQRPGSAKGVLFITLEDETGSMNLIVWPKLFDKYRRTILGSGMLGCEGRIQREGDVIHIIATRLVDLSGTLAKVGEKEHFPLPNTPADEGGGSGGDRRTGKPLGKTPRDIYIPDLHIERGISVKTRDFR